MSGAEPMQIVGICRFSYVATRGWKRAVRDDIRATEEMLYTPERMEERFLLFENVCLPSMLEQTDGDFRFLVLASSRMPAQYRDRLEALVAGHGRVALHYLRPRPMTEAVTVALRRTVDPDGPPAVQFCIDDDDALSVHYVARLRAAVSGILGSDFAARLPVAYNNPRGITLSKKGGDFVAHENFAPFLALGLAVITDATIPTNAYTVPHLKTATRLFALSDPEPMTYLRGLHDHHDSHGISKGRELTLDMERLAEYLVDEFPFITPGVIARVFQAPEAEVSALRASGSSAA